MTRARRPHRVAAIIIGSGTLLLAAGWPPAPVAAQTPTDPVVIVDPATANIGDTVLVDLQGWPRGAVTVSLCGNTSLRGSQDCDPIGAETVPIGNNGTQQLRLTITTPPVGCPCVVRANTTLNDVVRLAPFVVIGLPTGVHLTNGPSDPRQLAVSARVTDRSSWIAPIAGAAPRTLLVTLRNLTNAPLTGLRLVGTVHGHGNEPIAAHLPPVPAGKTRTVSVPFRLSFPAYGHYRVAGSIYGLAVPITYTTKTGNDPWALWLLIPLTLLAIAQYFRKRERDRRRAEAAADEAAAALAAQYPVYEYPPAAFRESSPGVGYPALGLTAPATYDPAREASYGVGAVGPEHSPLVDLAPPP